MTANFQQGGRRDKLHCFLVLRQYFQERPILFQCAARPVRRPRGGYAPKGVNAVIMSIAGDFPLKSPGEVHRLVIS
jgi:hypothetical protein